MITDFHTHCYPDGLAVKALGAVHDVRTERSDGTYRGLKSALAEAGIDLYPGAQGNCDDAVKSLIEGKLVYQPDIQCNHHHQEGHDCNHKCGEDKHGCGGNH